MGLDLVELVIRFEDAFGIAIPDKVATELTTPRKVTDYVLTQINQSGEGSCLSQQAFYFLRRRFVPALGISREDFRPDSPLENLIPQDGRREIWSNMKSELGPSALPNLARPVWLFSLLFLLTVVTLVIATIYSKHVARESISFFFGLFSATVVGGGGAVVTRPMQRNFRRGSKCAADLAKYLIIYSPHSFKKDWSRPQVAQAVREIIIEETGVRDFEEDSDFVKDMNLD